MFPVGTGMNRDIRQANTGGNHVPRRHGDEPILKNQEEVTNECSP